MAVYAEDMNYWKTSKRSVDTWMEMTRKEIEKADGDFLGEAYASESNGRAAFVIKFALDGDEFRITWPILESKTGNDKAAKVQASTMMYYDVKARCLAARVLGARVSFMSFLVLPDGRTAGQVASTDFLQMLPRMLSAGDL